jgi:hypothetical protein
MKKTQKKGILVTITKDGIRNAKRKAPKFFKLMDDLCFHLCIDVANDYFEYEYDRGSGYGECIMVACYSKGDVECSNIDSWADVNCAYKVVILRESGRISKNFRKLETLEIYLVKLIKKLEGEEK